MKIYERLAKYLQPYMGHLVLALICMAGVSGLTALTMYLIKPILDNVFIAHDQKMLFMIIVLMPVLFVAKGLLSFGQNYWMAYICVAAVADMRRDLFAHVHTLSLDFFNARSTGKVVARFTNDLAALQQVIGRIPIYLVRDGLTALCLVGVLISLSWKFTLITVGVLPVSGVVILVLGRTLRRLGHRSQQQVGEVYSVIQ